MLVPGITQVPRTAEELLGRDMLARLDRLDMHSHKVFAGAMPGERRSKRRGQGVEFDDHRPYVPGDDLRRLDWNIYARFDRFLVKLFREDEDLTVHIVLDTSASMRAGGPGPDAPSKLVYAARLALALGYIGVVAGNRVAITSFGTGSGAGSIADPIANSGYRRSAAGRGRGHVRALNEFVLASLARAAEPMATGGVGATGTFRGAMSRFVRERSGRGVVVLLSDLLMPSADRDALSLLSGTRGYDTHLLQILTPGELDPLAEGVAVTGDLRLTDIETGRPAEISVTRSLLESYRERVSAYTDAIGRFARAHDIRHMVVPTSTALDRLLLRDLRGRGLLR